MATNEKIDLTIDKGVSIKEWIEYNIKNHGAKNFFDCVNNSWDEVSDSIKQALLDEIQTQGEIFAESRSILIGSYFDRGHIML